MPVLQNVQALQNIPKAPAKNPEGNPDFSGIRCLASKYSLALSGSKRKPSRSWPFQQPFPHFVLLCELIIG
jgi:hypothetical protein